LYARAHDLVNVQVVVDLLVWFSAPHADYLDHESAVLFYSPYVEVGESAVGAVPGDGEGFQVFAVFFGLDDWYCGGVWLALHLCG
jgi:hypothetical protein